MCGVCVLCLWVDAGGQSSSIAAHLTVCLTLNDWLDFLDSKPPRSSSLCLPRIHLAFLVAAGVKCGSSCRCGSTHFPSTNIGKQSAAIRWLQCTTF